MMEEALKGDFQKYLINDGNATKHGRDTSNGRVCLAFAHWTLEFTNEAMVVTDLQGNVAAVAKATAVYSFLHDAC